MVLESRCLVVLWSWQRAGGPFFQEEAEGEQGDKPAVGVLFVGLPDVAELSDKVEPQNREGGEGEPEAPVGGGLGRKSRHGGEGLRDYRLPTTD